MEVDISDLKPPTGDNASITSSGKKPKKKSAVAKLAEKKRKSSESGSEFGSCASLQSNQNSNQNAKDTQPKCDNNQEDISNNALGKNSKPTDKNRKASTGSVKKNPRPAPRLKKPNSEKLDWDPPPPLDADEAANSGNKAPSDATIHRFRALKMASDPKGSLESLKNLPFQPKPPQTPKSENRGNSNAKGEKRNHEGSSGEEHEIETKSKKQSSSYINLKTETQKYENENTEDDVFMKNTPEKSMGSEGDLIEVTKKYHEIINSDSLTMPSPGSSKGFRGGPLPPVSPKSHLPPLGDLSSKSLKTTIKTDPSYNLQRYFSDKNIDNVSERSLSSSMAICPISIKEARARSGYRGNMSVTSALLGPSELERYFPDHRIKIWVGSWNMGDLKECRDPIHDFILPEESEIMQDIYAIGTQENNIIKKDWEIAIQATLGPTHVLFHSASHGSLHLAIFVRRDLIWFCSLPDDEQVSTRAVTMVRTKGAVAISFYFFGTSFLFVNCHLASDDGRLKERVSDYNKISSSLKVPKYCLKESQSTQGSDSLSKYDSVFWFGDLNFRIDNGRNTVEDLVKSIVEQEHPNFEFLLEGDELNNCIVKDQIFQGFLEGRINFKPTYKFDVDSDIYDTSPKLRIPSYTDRILYKAKKKNSISCLHYDAVMNIRLSDHRPVYGLYEAAIKPGRDNIPMGAGHFDRDVYLEANKRWDLHGDTEKKSQKSSGVCAIQ